MLFISPHMHSKKKWNVLGDVSSFTNFSLLRSCCTRPLSATDICLVCDKCSFIFIRPIGKWIVRHPIYWGVATHTLVCVAQNSLGSLKCSTMPHHPWCMIRWKPFLTEQVHHPKSRQWKLDYQWILPLCLFMLLSQVLSYILLSYNLWVLFSPAAPLVPNSLKLQSPLS